AEPAAAWPRVLILRNRELTAGVTDIAAVVTNIARDARRIADLPSFALEQHAVFFLVGRQRQLEPLRRPLRQIDDLEELVMLAPFVHIGPVFARTAVELHTPPALAKT